MKTISSVGACPQHIKLAPASGSHSVKTGGVQKEAYFVKVPCITLREETEWIETVESGWNVLVGADKSKIIGAISGMTPMGAYGNIFGNSRASEMILDILRREM